MPLTEQDLTDLEIADSVGDFGRNSKVGEAVEELRALRGRIAELEGEIRVRDGEIEHLGHRIAAYDEQFLARGEATAETPARGGNTSGGNAGPFVIGGGRGGNSASGWFVVGPAQAATAEQPAADLLAPDEQARRTRPAWWASLTDEQRRELERAPERRSVQPGRGAATTGATTRTIRTTVAPARLFDLLTPTDPDVIGWSPGELLYAEPEIRAKATHVVPLLPYHAPSVLEPYRDRAPRGLLAVLETPGDALVSFVVVEWASGPSDDGSIPNLYQPLFYGGGPSAPLRELRHTHWGHADDGYLHSPNGALIAAAFEALRRWFDCWRRT